MTGEQQSLEQRALIERLVERFLSWPLPKTFAPDCGITFTHKPDARGYMPSWPVGTNLFTADEARAMFEHVLADAAPAAVVITPEGAAKIEAWLQTPEGRSAFNEPGTLEFVPAAREQSKELRAERNQLRTALQELVRLKNIKNRLKGRAYDPRGMTRDFDGEAMWIEYEAGKEAAWNAARALLRNLSPDAAVQTAEGAAK
jgi:hypothetical protein